MWSVTKSHFNLISFSLFHVSRIWFRRHFADVLLIWIWEISIELNFQVLLHIPLNVFFNLLCSGVFYVLESPLHQIWEALAAWPLCTGNASSIPKGQYRPIGNIKDELYQYIVICIAWRIVVLCEGWVGHSLYIYTSILFNSIRNGDRGSSFCCLCVGPIWTGSYYCYLNNRTILSFRKKL